MRLPITPVTTLLRDLRTQVRAQSPAGRVIIAIDGLGDTSAFADAFAEVFAEDETVTFRSSMSGFLLPRSERVGSEKSPGWYDVSAMRRVLIEPFRDRGQTSATTGFQLSLWDAYRDQSEESRWVTSGPDAVLIVDGTFSTQPELRGAWNWSVWLDAGEANLAARPGRSLQQPYTTAEFNFLKTGPVRAASVVVDNADPDQPAQSYRDFC